MQPFTTLTGVAAPMPVANVDTDQIIPARFLKTIKRTGLGKSLFDGLRYELDGSEKPGFVLNQEPYRHAEILIAHENFGCGSSREHAPWALIDFGIRAVIAPSFADIFKSNCTKIGLLPIAVSEAACAAIAQSGTAQVDLAGQEVRWDGGSEHFEIEAEIKHRLLNGLDDIALTLAQDDAIGVFESTQERHGPVTTAL